METYHIVAAALIGIVVLAVVGLFLWADHRKPR